MTKNTALDEIDGLLDRLSSLRSKLKHSPDESIVCAKLGFKSSTTYELLAQLKHGRFKAQSDLREAQRLIILGLISRREWTQLVRRWRQEVQALEAYVDRLTSVSEDVQS